MKNLIFPRKFSPASTARPRASLLFRSFPKLYKIFSSFKNGFSLFTRQTLIFMKMKLKLKILTNNETSFNKYLHDMTWKDVEIYRQIPRDWKKVAPVMLISALPLVNYAILPVAYLYPDRLLCQQFWTVDQALSFAEVEHLKQAKLYNKLLDSLATHADLKFDLNRSNEKYIVIDCINKVIFFKLLNIFDFFKFLDQKLLFFTIVNWRSKLDMN